MKKNILKLMLVTCLVFLTTGCFKFEIKMGINEDKSVDLSYTYAFDLSSMKDFDSEEIANTINENKLDDEVINQFKEKGYEVKVVDDNKNSKYEFLATKKFANIDKISTDKDITVDLDEINEKDFNEIFFKKEKKGKKDLYTANFVLKNNDEEEAGELEYYQSMFDTKYVVTLPVAPVSHNATEVSEDGRTLTWKLSFTGTNEIKYTFELEKTSDSVFKNLDAPTVIIILTSVVVLSVTIAVVLKGKNKKNTEETNN